MTNFSVVALDNPQVHTVMVFTLFTLFNLYFWTEYFMVHIKERPCQAILFRTHVNSLMELHIIISLKVKGITASAAIYWETSVYFRLL